MTSLLKQRIVFGLFVLIVYKTVFVCAQIKTPVKVSHPISPHQAPIPSTSNVMQPNRRPPSMITSSLESFKSINLESYTSSHSSTAVHRSMSTPSLTNERTPAILPELDATHNRAASVLNMGRMHLEQPQPRNNFIQRLRPNPQNMNTYLKYLKNGAIGAAGIGGVITIADFLSNKNGGEHIIVLPITSTTTTSTTQNPEYYNPIGPD